MMYYNADRVFSVEPSSEAFRPLPATLPHPAPEEENRHGGGRGGGGWGRGWGWGIKTGVETSRLEKGIACPIRKRLRRVCAAAACLLCLL